MARIKTIKTKVLETKIEKIDVLIFVISAKDLVKVSYVAVRGQSAEKAAVQRLFSKKRVEEISTFVAEGGQFFSPFILNWNSDKPIKISSGNIELPIVPEAAQLLDGQHRFMGIKHAIENKTSNGNGDVIVVLAKNLETKEAARIFTNINSKQKSVSKSLIYDLFTELEEDPNHNVNRAHDIAVFLNTEPESPYYGLIKFPGKPTRKGMLELSMVIDSIKDHVDKKGSFPTRNVTSLEGQSKAIMNYFAAIQLAYEEEGLWDSAVKNPFLGAAGFRGGIDVLTSTILEKCASQKSFTTNTFKKILSLKDELLIKNDESFKSLGGKEQVKAVIGYLSSSVQQNSPSESEYEF